MIISGYGGYVLKYVGDAVIGIFPADFDPQKACLNSIMCAKTMLNIITQVINPVFYNKLPLIEIKIGIDLGDSMIVLYGKNVEIAHIDIIGSGISIASKITALAKPNQILISENIFETIVEVRKDISLTQLDIVNRNWDYKNIKTNKILNVYVLN
jgi:class 3 adenylate cyclase